MQSILKIAKQTKYFKNDDSSFQSLIRTLYWI